MLDKFYVNPILPAQDGDRARAFYRDVLGLELLSGAADDPMMFRAGSGARGATFQELAPGSFAGQEGVQRGDVMDFGPVKSAMLLDSEGNVLALNEILG